MVRPASYTNLNALHQVAAKAKSPREIRVANTGSFLYVPGDLQIVIGSFQHQKCHYDKSRTENVQGERLTSKWAHFLKYTNRTAKNAIKIRLMLICPSFT